MNTMRVFLQDQLWLNDPEAARKLIDQFLAIAAKHHIRPSLFSLIPAGSPIPILVHNTRQFREFITPDGYKVLGKNVCSNGRLSLS